MSQPLFYIASSPTYGSHINISPKGLPSTTFSILSPNKAAYIDATGSGAETIAHLYENGRCTVMFCSFEQSPRILRLFCKGEVVEVWEDGFGEVTRGMGMEVPVGARAVIRLEIFKVCICVSCHLFPHIHLPRVFISVSLCYICHNADFAKSFLLRKMGFCKIINLPENNSPHPQVQTSCGYGVPLLSPTSATKPLQDRETLGHWAGKTVSDNKMVEYRAKNNAYSLDNLPGLKAGRKTRGEWLWVADVRAYMQRLWNQMDALVIGFVLAFVVIDLLHLAGVRVNGVLADWR